MLTINEYKGRPGQDDIEVRWTLDILVGKDTKTFEGTFIFSQSKYMLTADRWSDDELKNALAQILAESVKV